MKLKMFTVYDSKVEAFKAPFFMQSKGAALRGFQTVANDPQTEICKYAADFTLFELGEYDDESGTVTQYETKLSLGTALEHQQKE